MGLTRRTEPSKGYSHGTNGTKGREGRSGHKGCVLVVHRLGRGSILFLFRRGGGLVRMWRILGSTRGMVVLAGKFLLREGFVIVMSVELGIVAVESTKQGGKKIRCSVVH